VLDVESNSNEVLVGVDERVGDRGKGGVVGGERDASNGLDSTHESLDEVLLVDVQDGSVEALTLVVDLRDGHTVGERGDVEHVQQGSLGRSDLSTGLNELQVGGNFNGTTSDLGGDTEGLEERGLSGLHTGVSSGNKDIGRSDGTGTSRGSDNVGQDDVPDLLKVVVGENETDVAWTMSVRDWQDRRDVMTTERTLDVGKETLVLGEVGAQDADSATNHGVLSHEDDTTATESLTDLVHLLGGDLEHEIMSTHAFRRFS
jgi:hypothetical protein